MTTAISLLASVGCMEWGCSVRAFHLDGWAGEDIRRLLPRQSPLENGLVRGAREGRLHNLSVVPKENGGSMCFARLPDPPSPTLSHYCFFFSFTLRFFFLFHMGRQGSQDVSGVFILLWMSICSRLTDGFSDVQALFHKALYHVLVRGSVQDHLIGELGLTMRESRSIWPCSHWLLDTFHFSSLFFVFVVHMGTS